MASHGIKDRVAIVGMGCTPFGEHWDKGADDLLDRRRRRGVRVGRHRPRTTSTRTGSAPLGSGMQRHHARPAAASSTTSRSPASRTICATGSEAFRNACYAVASGAYDVAMAVGVEKLKDSGYSGLIGARRPERRHRAARSPRRRCSRCSRRPTPRSTASTTTRCKDVLARIAWKNHYNGARNPRAQFRKEVSMETIAQRAARRRARSASSTARAWPTARPRRSSCGPRTPTSYTDKPLYVKALSFVAGNGRRRRSTRRTTTRRSPRSSRSRRRRLRAGRHHRPARRARDGRGARLLHADRAGAHGGPRLRRAGHGVEGGARRHVRPRRRAAGQPRRRPEGFGHPVGASGLRMLFECWLQLRGEARPSARSPASTDGRKLGPHPQPRRLPRRVRELRRRSSAPSSTSATPPTRRRAASRSSTERCPPSARATPERSVKRPPASSTITCTAARSHRLTTGSTATSNTPSATRTCIQKSPRPRLRHTRCASATNGVAPSVLAPRADAGVTQVGVLERSTADTCKRPVGAERARAPGRPPAPAERRRGGDAHHELAVVLERDQRPPDRQTPHERSRCRRSGRGSTATATIGSPIRPSSSPSTAWSGRARRAARASPPPTPCRRRSPPSASALWWTSRSAARKRGSVIASAGVGQLEGERQLGARGRRATSGRRGSSEPWPRCRRRRGRARRGCVGLAVRDERDRHAEHLDARDVGPASHVPRDARRRSACRRRRRGCRPRR